MWRLGRRSLLLLLVQLTLPTSVFAQAILAGVVRDVSGGVLPGVTVEATSAALIEKVRAAVTDGTGQFRIVDLPPGEYSLTFTLPGFAISRRDGVALSGTFTATVNVEMRVGALEETVTVVGETPIVDVQSTDVQRVINKDLVSAIPTGRTAQGLQVLIPGIVGTASSGAFPDTGGSSGSSGGTAGSIHGGRPQDSRMLNDGLTTAAAGAAGGGGNLANAAGAQEIVITTSGGLGEAETGGLTVNLVPREGSNRFSGTVYLSGVNSSMQGSNYTQDLRDRGLRAPGRILKVYDINPMGGGPILRDRLWFYVTERVWGADNTIPGLFINKNAGNPNAWTYDPDLSRQAFSDIINKTHIARLTWQATARNKFSSYWSEQYNCNFCRGGLNPTETTEATNGYEMRPSHIQQATWSAPLTNRLLLDARFGQYVSRYGNGYTNGRTDGTAHPSMIRVVEQGGVIPGLAYRNPTFFGRNSLVTRSWKASLSYSTGAHYLKVGYFGGYSTVTNGTYFNGEIIAYRFNNGVPNQLTQTGVYPGLKDNTRAAAPTALYAQDQWTMGRLTVEGGARYDYVRTLYPEQRVGGTRIIPEQIVFPAGSTPGISWHDVTPRMGAAYDLFGNGKTAVKVSLGKFMEAITSGSYPLDLNPVAAIQTETTRTWTDRNQDFVADCDLANPDVNGECGAMANRNVGKVLASRTWDPNYYTGWGNRPFNWELAASVQHELFPRVSVTTAYFRRWFGNWFLIKNQAVIPSDYTPFSLQAPTDPRLPNGGGHVVGGLYDLVPAKVGQVDERGQASKNFGEQIETWHGVDVTVSARLRNGLTVEGATSSGRRIADNCAIRAVLPELGYVPPPIVAAPFAANLNAASPTNPYCRVVEPVLTRLAGLATYTFPRVDIQLSATWQSNPGPELGARWNAPNAVVRPSLGRDLSGGAANIPVPVVVPGTLYGDRINQIDFRAAKLLRFGRTKTQLMVDVFNTLNADTPTTYDTTFVPGGPWLTPTSVVTARFVKLGVQVDF